MIIALDVEENARAKDAPGTSAQGASANIIVNKPTYKGKGKDKMNYGGKPKKMKHPLIREGLNVIQISVPGG